MVEITKEIRDAAQAEFDRWDTASGMGPSAEKPWQIVRLCNHGGAPDFIVDEVGWTIKGEYTFLSKASAALMAMRLEAILAAVTPLIEAAVRAEGWRPIAEAPKDGRNVPGWSSHWDRWHSVYFHDGSWRYRDGQKFECAPKYFFDVPVPWTTS